MAHLVQLFFLVLCFFTIGNTQNPCSTPDNRPGTCIDLNTCASLFNLIRQPNLSIASRDYLRNSRCRFNQNPPWVCCPQDGVAIPTTPTRSNTGLQRTDLPEPGVCGPVLLGDRVYGGTNTSINEFPWMVLIEYTKPRGLKGFHCGGVLINKDYVLTASHCFRSNKIAQLRWTLSGVRLGEWDQRTDQDCEEDLCSDPVVDVPVVERISHPNYNPNSKSNENDIALLRLARPVQFTDWIKPICLPFAQSNRISNFQNFPFIVAGWGKTETAYKSEIKLKVELNGTSLNQCNNVYRTQNVVLNEKHICAGGQPGKDACQGDSGGPLMALDDSDASNKYFYLAGVVSFGRSCGLEGWPGVYTRVDQYTDWILENMRP